MCNGGPVVAIGNRSGVFVHVKQVVSAMGWAKAIMTTQFLSWRPNVEKNSYIQPLEGC